MHELKLENGLSASVSGDAVSIKGPLGSNQRQFNSSLLSVKADSGKLIIEPIGAGKLRKKAEIASYSLYKELQNDAKGVQKYFEIEMEAIYAHFPLTMEVKGQEFIIKNLFGERYPRKAEIVGNTKAEIKEKKLRLYGTKLDDVAQTAANIRQACKLKHKDERVFQDGVYYSIG
ncbi:50S ribosomal protein L6 [Candidatus Marsarchaeota archaeon]|nr:50S ribosomal protein L6 [Candidatus Marsarchaeota archaeon]MCL5404538.1 50S ribosomal protein L6 [Candidatus Marsarchaeota archaeon]